MPRKRAVPEVPYAGAFAPIADGPKRRTKKEEDAIRNKWPPSVLSFEAWAMALCYDSDPKITSGGAHFQALMHSMLTAGMQSNGQQYPKLGNVHWSPNDYLVDTEEGFNEGTKDLRHVPSTFAQVRSTAGLRQGALSNNSGVSGFYSDLGDQSVRAVLSGITYSPIGKCNFFSTAGFDLTAPKRLGGSCAGTNQNQMRQFTVFDKNGSEGCVSWGCHMAAVYGLYFYEGCGQLDRNWEMETEVEGKLYKIRMRLPNPYYELDNGHLYVMTKLRDTDDFVGGDAGFGFANVRVGPARFGSISYDLLLVHSSAQKKKQGGAQSEAQAEDTGLVAGIAPFVGKYLEQMANASAYPDNAGPLRWVEKGPTINLTRDMKEVAQLLKGTPWSQRVHVRESGDGLAWGWALPQALVLYPHSGEGRPRGRKKAVRPGYQPFPDWMDGNNKNRLINQWNGERFYTFFKMPPVSDSERLKFALGLAFVSGTEDEVLERYANIKPKAAPKPQMPSADVKVTGATREADPTDAAEDPDDTEGGQPEVDPQAQSITLDTTVLKEQGESLFQHQMDEEGKPLEGEELKILKEKERLIPGSKYAKGEGTGNHHFYSLNHSPWPPLDVYEKPEHGIKFKDANYDAYKAKYGNTSNLFLRSTEAREIDRIEVSYGRAKWLKGSNKRILDLTLDAYTYKSFPKELVPVFRKNMRRILSIYWDNSGSLGVKSSFACTPDQKRKGMRYGVKRCANEKGNWRPWPWNDDDGNCSKGSVIVFKPVFEGNPPENLFTDKDGNLRNEDTEETPEEIDALQKVRSTMTVLEWLQTPWHYQYLPYQPMTSTFRDGESYCAGCMRCARPFYEYKHQYASYLLSEKGTAHWPHLYWWPEKPSVTEAPQPFHEEEFWTAPKLAHNVQRDASTGNIDEPDPERGYHNWLTKVFKLGWKDKDTRYGKWDRTTWKQSGRYAGPLKHEWEVRANKEKLDKIRTLHFNKKAWTFREYINHMWDPEENYNELTQGKMSHFASKVRFCATNYKLMRSIKYGNTCRDCAGTLDLVGLYERTGVTRLQHTLAGTRQVEPGTRSLTTFWMGLMNTQVSPGVLFDPWFIFLETGFDDRYKYNKVLELGNNFTRKKMLDPDAKFEDGTPVWNNEQKKFVNALVNSSRFDEATDFRETTMALQDLLMRKDISKHDKLKILWGSDWETKLEQHMNALANFTNARNCRLYMGDRQLTKYKQPPKVTIQPVFEKTRDSEVQRKKLEEELKKAKKAVDGIMLWLEGGALPERSNSAALKDLLRQKKYELDHQFEYMLDPGTAHKRFDSQHVRKEFRNEIRTAPDRKKYRNCLVVEQLMEPVLKQVKDQKKASNYTNTPALAKQGISYEIRDGQTFRTTISYWDEELKAAYPPDSDWRGDRFLLNGSQLNALARSNTYPHHAVQTRMLQQTRVFITYSLHRRIQTPEEARCVMERMGDAVRRLFGNDEELCKLILFGFRLSKPDKQTTVSSRRWEHIPSARKEDTIFYGGKSGNSYTSDSYATHVESTDLDAGIEIGPTYHMPHFHALVTINHYSYIHVDTRRMSALLEQMFKGIGDYAHKDFYLQDCGGLPFYTDNENPYVDIRVFPSDNWAEVIAGYVRKTAMPGIFEAKRMQTGMN